jgi:hypothetical protein
LRRWLLFLALGLGWAGQATADVSPTALSPDLQAYCAKIAQAVEGGGLKPRFFVEVGGGDKKTARWREFKDQALLDKACKNGGCFQEAWAYVDGGHLALAAFTFADASAHWANNVDYYFYPNGVVAKDHSQLRRSGATSPQDASAAPFLVEVVRARYYDDKAQPLAVDPPQCFKVEGESRRPIAGAKFAEGAWPRFKRIQDLPIARLLKARAPKPTVP